MPSHKEKQRTGKAGRARKQKQKPNADDWQALEGYSMILGFIKWCAFVAGIVCFASGSLAWPWLTLGVVAWIGASRMRRRSERAYERLYGPSPPPAPYIPTSERPRQSLGTMESILIGVLLGGAFFGGDGDDE